MNIIRSLSCAMAILTAFVAMAAHAQSPAQLPSSTDGLVIRTATSFAATYHDLPATTAVIAALETASPVRLAHAAIKIEEAQRERLLLGPYEFVAHAGTARRYDPLRQTRDFDLALERPIRIGQKALLDQRIGDSGLEVAKFSLVDARHEAGRLLLRQWIGHLRAIDERAIWTTQLSTLQRQLDAVNGRVRAGDAPRVDVFLVQAALAQAEQGASQADARIELSRVDLMTNFPDLPISIVPTTAPTLAQPAAPADDEAGWRSRIIEHNHEIQVAQAQRAQASLVASRVRAERVPDPSVGVRYLSERGGSERVLGITLSIPIPGAIRDAALQSALAQVDVRGEREAAVLRRVGGEASSLYRAARSSFEIWGKADLAVRRLTQHADLAARAYSLGEGTLSEVLLARRSANESRLQALAAQSDAQEARYRLILDAHLLWPFDDDDHRGAGPLTPSAATPPTPSR